MADFDPPTGATPVTPARARPRFRGLRIFLAILVLAIAALFGTFAWLIASESGLRTLSRGLERLSGGQLVIDQPSGRLIDNWSARSLRWRDAGQAVTIEQLEVKWSPRELWQHRLTIERLAAASLSIASASSDEPAVLPEQLELPVAVNIAQIQLGRVLSGDFAAPDKPPQLLAEGVDAALRSDGRKHRIEHLRATLGKLALNADATLESVRPFAIDLRAGLHGAALGQKFSLDMEGSGSLESLQVEGRATSEAAAASGVASTAANDAVTGTLRATVTPFATRPLADLRVQLAGVDPARLVDGAPAALLDIDAVLDTLAPDPATGAIALSGRVKVDNRRSGSVDRQLLPVESLQSKVDWADEQLQLADLEVALSGGGQLKGNGRFAGGQLDLDLSAKGIDAHAMYSSLLPTRLSGPLKVSAGADRQTVDLDLRDARYALKARASLAAEVIEVAELDLAYENARLQANGRMALGGDGQFSARGQLQNFEPARFLKDQVAALGGLPGTRISAGFDAQGVLRPALQLGLHFDLKDSRINGQKLAGQGDVDLAGSRVRKAAVDLDVAGNRLSSSGAFGEPGDRLRLQVQAPRLESLGLSNIYGDAQADLTLGGSIAQPELAGELSIKRLKFASLLDLREVTLKAQLGAGSDGVLAGTLRCGACALPSAGVPALAISLQADGLRSKHHLRAQLDLPDERQLRVSLDGGLQDGSPTRNVGRKEAPGKRNKTTSSEGALSWNGALGELWLGRLAAKGATASAPALLELKGASPLQLGENALAFGPAALTGSFGDLSIERLSLEAGQWQSAGRWKNFRPTAILAEFPALADWRTLLGPQSFSLAGEWDLAYGDRPSGRVAIWRETGDLSLASLSLGLAETRLQTTLDAGRLAATLEIHGARLGDISAQLETPFDSIFDAASPLQGKLQASMPDLAWLSPLLGEGWQLAGQVDGQMRFSGSVGRPQFAGSWRGTKLAVRALDQGMRLERGEAQIDITPEKLLLRRLVFDSELQALPRVLQVDPRIDAARLTGTPGRFEASGELVLRAQSGASDLAAGAAKLQLKLDRVGIMQQPNQWVAVSGDGELRIGEAELVASGKLAVDAGFWRLADSGRPSLSDDVVIRRAGEKQAASPMRRALRLDLLASLGNSFHFRGAGVESRLAGDLRIRSDDAGLPRASGSIRTVGGRFDAYGQKLDIQRGIVNFQGAIDNPGLNILAVRPNLPVEAGVEVTGTAQHPVIRLVSTPNVPDTEKLSWLVLGRAPDQQGGDDSSLLFAAAQTIFGGQDDGLLSRLQQGLGIDEFGVNSGQVGGGGRQATSQVASTSGFGQSQTVSGQVVSIGKRLSSNALLSYEQSLSTTESIVKLTVDLSRRFSVVGRAGTDSAVDFFWHYRFGK